WCLGSIDQERVAFARSPPNRAAAAPRGARDAAVAASTDGRCLPAEGHQPLTPWSRKKGAQALRTPFGGADRSDPARVGRRAIEDHAEGRLGWNAGRRQRQQEVARNGQPLAASCDGCGGGI